MASRLPSQWLGQVNVSASAAMQEGNLLDRVIYLVLILFALLILQARAITWGDFWARNPALSCFLLFALLSTVWSDYPFVSFKRWIRDFGNYLMLIVILTEPRQLEAIKTLLRRFVYFLVPLSVLLIKYYPHLGKGYSIWSGQAFFIGVTTTKNMLGVLCLVGGVFLFWDTLTRWSHRKEPQTRKIVWVNLAFGVMTLWLLNLADSATSTLCLGVACAIILAAHRPAVRAQPARLKVLIPGALCLYLILELGFGFGDWVISAMGRESTLTGRTELWNDLRQFETNPLLGTGYESFWLGSRLEAIWALHAFMPNQAHNGYLEVYLNLGLVGLALLAGFLISSYLRIGRRMTSIFDLASLGLALWSILLIYNVTEAAFKSHLLWFTFLLGSVAAPEVAAARSRSAKSPPSKVRAAIAR